MIVTDEGKRYRVICWLDSLLACSRRLADVRAALTIVNESIVDIGAVRFDHANVKKSVECDAIEMRVIRHDEKTRQLEDEAQLLEQAVWNAERTIHKAWETNRGELDGCFRYVIEHYARGTGRDEAARLSGLSRYEAMLSARRVAVMIYDASPESFNAPTSKWGLYGYWEFVFGHGNGKA